MEALLAFKGVLVGLCIGFVGVGLVRLPDSRLSRALVAFCASAALWATGELVGEVAPDLFWEQVGIAVLYSGSIFLPALWWRLALRWAETRGFAWLRSPWWTRVPLLFAAVLWGAMITNPWHGTFIEPVLEGKNGYGPLWWVMAVPNYALVLGVAAVELGVLRRMGSPESRRQAALMLVPSAIVLIANWAYVLSPSPGMPGALPVLVAAEALLVFALYREGLFGVLPLALPVVTHADPDGLVVVRPDGRVLYANPSARDILWPARVTLERRIADVLSPWLGGPADAGPVGTPGWWSALEAPGGRVHAYGEEGDRQLHFAAQRVVGRHRLVAWSLRIRDLTEERRVESELRRAHRLESAVELARGVAHDFRNMLGVVRGNAEFLAEDLPDRRDWQRRVYRILESERHATELAEQLRLYAGGADPLLRPVDLSDLVRDVWDYLEAEGGSGLAASLVLDRSPLPVEADPTQIRRVAMNLFVNAREALGESGGTVRVETGDRWLDPATEPGVVSGREVPAGPFAGLRVVDDGPGMDAATQERLFDAFFSTKGKRRGVGLATVLGIARAHGGVLQLRTAPGRGTEITLHLPMDRDAAEGDVRDDPPATRH